MTRIRREPPARGRRGSTVMAAVLALCLLAACTSQSESDGAPGPVTTTVLTTTTAPSTPVTSSSSPPAAAPTPAETGGWTTPESLALIPNSVESAPATDGLDPQEALDRRAAEDTWYRFWDVYIGLPEVPEADRPALVREIATTPIDSAMLQATQERVQNHSADFGGVVHRLSWETPPSGTDFAVVKDCLDQSKSGSFDDETGQILAIGTARTDVTGNLMRSADGTWRVVSVDASDAPC